MARLTCPAVAAPVDRLPPFSPGAPGTQGSVMWGLRDVFPKGKADDALAGLGLLGSQTPFNPVSGQRESQGDGFKRGGPDPTALRQSWQPHVSEECGKGLQARCFLVCLVFQSLEDLQVRLLFAHSASPSGSITEQSEEGSSSEGSLCPV